MMDDRNFFRSLITERPFHITPTMADPARTNGPGTKMHERAPIMDCHPDIPTKYFYCGLAQYMINRIFITFIIFYDIRKN